jgi:hypothetical protein
MKRMKIFAAMFIALVAMSSCWKEDNPVAGPASQEQLDQLGGHWYAELPISGMTKNLLTTDDPDDMAPFNSIGALIYFHNQYTDWSYWGYFYMHDGKFVNVDGLDHHGEEGVFDFTMDSNGNIKTTAHTSNAPQVSNMHFQGDKITAKVTYMGRSLDVTFRQPDEEQQEKLDAIWDQLLELDIVGGSDYNNVETNIKDSDAHEPSRARQK